jgi:hypothetical protein
MKTPAIVIALSLAATHAIAFEADEYRSLVAETVITINQGDVDVSHLISIQETLVQLGVDGVSEFGANNPEYSEIMAFVASRAQSMSQMTLDEVEDAWHEGAAFAEIGVDFHDLDHFGPAVSQMDTVIHPATAIIALREYQATGDDGYLDQVIDELTEVVEHLAMIN